MVPLTTVTIVTELISVPVGETEFEADSKSDAEVEGIGVILEKVEVIEVVGMGVGEDEVNINVDIVGVVLVGVDGSSVVNGTNIGILVFAVKNVESREHKHIPS